MRSPRLRFPTWIACALALASVPGAGVAQPPQASPVIPRGPYDLAALRGICDFVYSAMPTGDSSEYRFRWELMMATAAGVKPDDSRETKRRRIQNLWRDNQVAFRCTASNFNRTDGNILKYSARSRSYDFLAAAIEELQLELNFIDPTDHETVLDYVAKERAANKGNSQESALQEFQDGLKEAGAKHCAQLIAANHCAYPSAPTTLTHNGAQSAQYAPDSQRAVAEYNRVLRERR